MKEHHVIMGVHVTDRFQEVAAMQRILTEYGTHIRTRLGMHETSSPSGAPEGVILLDLVGAPERLAGLKEQLLEVPGLEVQEMLFTH